ncbi:hypothetical protein R84B8_02357 [Treponema sp. R8-4-B8]
MDKGKVFHNITDVVDKNILHGILERDILHINDNISFKNKVDVFNSLFNKNYKQGFACFGKCYFKISEKKYIWFPPLDKRHGVWINTMPDELHLHQIFCGEPKGHISNPLNVERAIFSKKPNDNYKFTGVFINDGVDGNTEKMKRISPEMRISEWIR